MSDSIVPMSSSLANPLAPSHQGHAIQLYSGGAYLLDVLSRFVADALMAGHAAVVIATASHRGQLERRLSALGLAPTKASSQGRYVKLDANETLAQLLVRGSIDEIRFNEIIGGV